MGINFRVWRHCVFIIVLNFANFFPRKLIPVSQIFTNHFRWIQAERPQTMVIMSRIFSRVEGRHCVTIHYTEGQKTTKHEYNDFFYNLTMYNILCILIFVLYIWLKYHFCVWDRGVSGGLYSIWRVFANGHFLTVFGPKWRNLDFSGRKLFGH